MGINAGWHGLLEISQRKLSRNNVENIHLRGGTILGSSRTNPLRTETSTQQTLKNIQTLRLDGIIAIGGVGTDGYVGGCVKDRVIGRAGNADRRRQIGGRQ